MKKTKDYIIIGLSVLLALSCIFGFTYYNKYNKINVALEAAGDTPLLEIIQQQEATIKAQLEDLAAAKEAAESALTHAQSLEAIMTISASLTSDMQHEINLFIEESSSIVDDIRGMIRRQELMNMLIATLERQLRTQANLGD